MQFSEKQSFFPQTKFIAVIQASVLYVMELCKPFPWPALGELIPRPHLVLFICRSHLKAGTLPEAYAAISYMNSNFCVANNCSITTQVHLNAFQAAKA